MKSKINLSIDDVSPHPRSSERVVDQCFRVLDRFPEAKFSLFVPVAYWRTIGPTATSTPLWLEEFPQFCKFLRELPKQSFEVCYHGLHHGIPHKSNNDELQHLDLDVARQVIEKMKEGVSKAGLSDVFKGILRPPAWRMSPKAFDACLEFGIDLFALSPDDYALATYQGAEKGVKHVMYNACPPQKPLKMLEKIEVVYHACEWDSSYLSPKMTDELLEFVSVNETNLEFCFIGDLTHG